MSFTEEYKSQFQQLLEMHDITSTREQLFSFLTKWRSVHTEVIAAYDKDKTTESDVDEKTKALLKLRERMISAFVQGSKSHGRGADTAILAQFVRQHDEILSQILQRALSKIKAELIKAHATKRALSGYAETMSGRIR